MEFCAGLRDAYEICGAFWDLGPSVYDFHKNVGFFLELLRYTAL